ncbi:unnamed protein product [Parnassius apollo]|uniref:(apollo) hypothetical protein n=1 Tax=Parnassius apollo TaxID=110799 RepID=A0A8S3XYA8_PARAO|nr:unnamed protein product [Parnassius apollo]
MDDSILNQEVDERSCNDPSVLENCVEDGVVGSPKPHLSCHYHQTEQIDPNPTDILSNQTLETVNEHLPTTSAPDDAGWVDTVADILDFTFDQTLHGPRMHINEAETEKDVFDLLLTPDLVEYLVNCTNAYGN